MDTLLALLRSDANAVNAFGALASAVAAFLALILSLVSVGISFWAVRSERRHNELSVRPLAEITYVDYENSIRVKLRNHGTGPMIVTSLTATNGIDSEASLVDLMPDLPMKRLWNTFVDNLADRSLSAGGELVLLELTEHENERDFARSRDLIRQELSRVTISVEYNNIYGTAMPPRVKKLEWFGRHNAA